MNLNKKQSAARQVEMIVRQLGSLSTLPEVAAGFLNHVINGQFTPADLTTTIESDPALSSQILALAAKEKIDYGPEGPSIGKAITSLNPGLLRDALLSVKVVQAIDIDQDPDTRRVLPRKEFARHCLAVACCAAALAENVLPAEQRKMAFTAGLLHDIGKCALDEVMPKSFERIVVEARQSHTHISEIEQKHLGLDHTLIGKRLGEKWNLPEPIIHAIWLHHSDMETLWNQLPNGKFVQVIHLADKLARQCNLGMSGSFEPIQGIEQAALALELPCEQIERLCLELPAKVQSRSDLLGLNIPGGAADYYNLVQKTTTRLAKDNVTLNQAKDQYEAANKQIDFLNAFVTDPAHHISVMELADHFVRTWQHTFECGLTALMPVIDTNEALSEIAIINRDSTTQSAVIQTPLEGPLFTDDSATEFTAAEQNVPWLIDQLDGSFNRQALQSMPLTNGTQLVGILLFEPLQTQPSFKNVALCCNVTAGALTAAMDAEKHKELSERFVQLLSHLKKTRHDLSNVHLVENIAELAAGAAHELNNPLAVISGRAQLLLNSEQDESKIQTLKQITDRTEEIASIVRDLMEFARPRTPKKDTVSLRELIDTAIADVGEPKKLFEPQFNIAAFDDNLNVYADRFHLQEALVRILKNAIESYDNEAGPVDIQITESVNDNTIVLTIRDQGCGMNAETLKKAKEPFFSYKPAGRQRGMGLAHAERLLQLNNGDIHINSTVNEGTTITIKLPKAQPA